MNNFFNSFLGKPQDRNNILTPSSDKINPDDLVKGRRDLLKGASNLAVVAAVGGLVSLSKNVEAAPNMELRKELIDNQVIFSSKSDIVAAFERYQKGYKVGNEMRYDMTVFNFYYPRYIGNQNPNISRISPQLIVSKVNVKNLDDRVVEVPLLAGETMSILSENIVVKTEIVGGSGWVILPAGTQIITGADGKKKIAACRNEIHEEIKEEEEKKCIPKCVSFRCNYPETVGGQKTGIVATKLIPAKGDMSIEAGKNICQAYAKDNLDKIKAEFNSKK